MHHAFSKPRLFGDKKQQRHMSTLIVPQHNKTNRLMRPKTDGTNDPTKKINTNIYARQKYLLVHKTSTYDVSLYSKLECRVLLFVGWPLSSFLQLFLNFHNECIEMHIAKDSHIASFCSSESTQVCLRNTLIRQMQS